jgi:Fic family protein
MKIPIAPPSLEKISQKKEHEKYWNEILPFILNKTISAVTDKNEYIHWDKLRHLEPPTDLTSETWWFAIKYARQSIYKKLPFLDKYGKSMLLAMPDVVNQKLHLIDRKAGNLFPNLNLELRDNYLEQSLMEEAITSSQFEGASTTRKAAKEMLQMGRKPHNKSEQMILNNYHAMQFVQTMKNERLTIEMILELHRILTEKTLDNDKEMGHLRQTEDAISVRDSNGVELHIPPSAIELVDRLQILCNFANKSMDNDIFMHPVLKAILLHFVLAYDHPFIDGNGRTARALFYWCMVRENYPYIEFISISSILKKSPSAYARAFLYTETDENDVTYFVLHQLDIILKAMTAFNHYVDKKSLEIKITEKMLHSLHDKLNYRQIALIGHALKHPGFQYKISIHRQFHKITYETARTDLLGLEELNLLIKKKIRQAFCFVVPGNLKKRIQMSQE